jgi:hypothetical protein
MEDRRNNARRSASAERWGARGVVLVAALTGLVDAAIGSNWDLVVLFAVVIAATAYDAVRTMSHRPAVRIRADLVAWMDRRAAAHGEPLDAVADRAIAAYRAGLTGDEAA